MEERRNNILKICHIADIHIRPTQRHDEYRRVFENLKKSIRENQVDCVWIGGDIFHTKLSGISPEYINLLYDTLRSLREVCEVHMMLGNHDGNLKNLERLDAVSPIVSIMDDPKVKLYKTSGVYSLNEKVNWCVYSPFDPENWSKIKPAKGKYNIACFHGAVSGAKTATDWELEGEKTVSDFDGFDVALLGDIHKMQFLGNYKPPRIAYPGSLIQQSYDEDLDHGYLLWTIDLETRKRNVEFFKVEGANPFVTLTVNEDNYKSVVKNNLDELKSVRCRIICEDLTVVQKNSLKDTLSSFQTHEVVLIDNQKSDKSAKKRISEALKLDSTDSLVSQAKHYAEHNIKTTASWENIEFEIRAYAEKLKVGTIKPHRWTLKGFEFDNLYSYGEGNKIDFSSLDGLIGVIGPNASGKSSVLGALLYSLFNSSDRDCTKNAFYINDSKDSSSALSKIDVDGLDYEILRTSIRHPVNRDASATKLHLKSKSADLTGEQRNDTDKVIKDLIGTVDDFMLTSMAAQEDLGKFLKEGSTTRKEIVSRFLGIDCLSDIHSLAKKEMNLIKTERKVYNNSSVEMMERDLSKKEIELKNLIKVLTLKTLERTNTSDKIKSLELKLAQAGATGVSKKSLEADLSKLEVLHASIRDQISDQEKKKYLLSEEVEKIEAEIAGIDSLKLAQSMKEAIDLKDRLGSAQSDLSLAEQSAKSAEKSSLKLLEVPCGDSFPTCKFITDSHKDKKSLAGLRKKVDDVEAIVEDFRIRLKKLDIEEILLKNKQKDGLGKDRDSKLREMQNIESLLSSRKDSLTKVAEKIESIKVQFKLVDEKSASILEELKSSHLCVQKEVDDLNSLSGSARKEIELLEKQIEICSALDQRLELLETIVGIFSKDGLPRFIMSQHLDQINNRMNDLLSKVIDFTVELRMDDEKGNLEAILKKRGKKRIAELGSGMERTLVSIALRVALREISCIPMPDFFIVDEGFSMLDSENIMACKNLLVELKKIFRFVIVMTHNDSVKEMMDRTIEVSMSGEFSKIDSSST